MVIETAIKEQAQALIQAFLQYRLYFFDYRIRFVGPMWQNDLHEITSTDHGIWTKTKL